MCAVLLPPGVNQMCAVLLPPGVNQMCAVLLPHYTERSINIRTSLRKVPDNVDRF
jgi:hypothetical protein